MPDETRIVSFLVVSDRLSSDALRSVLGDTDVAHKPLLRFPDQASWELRSAGGSDADIGGMVDHVLGRVAPMTDKLTQLRTKDPGLTCKLQIVGYIEEGPVEPGFGLSRAQVSLLAALGAFVDADLYYYG